MNDLDHLPLPSPPLPDDEEERDLERLRQLGLSAATDLFGVILELDRLVDCVSKSGTVTEDQQ